MTAFHMIDGNRRIRRAERARKHAELLKAHKTARANRELSDKFFADLDAGLLVPDAESVLDEDYEDGLLLAAAELGIDLTVGP